MRYTPRRSKTLDGVIRALNVTGEVGGIGQGVQCLGLLLRGVGSRRILCPLCLRVNTLLLRGSPSKRTRSLTVNRRSTLLL